MKEWQRHGQDNWVYGEIVRGVVRDIEAEVYRLGLGDCQWSVHTPEHHYHGSSPSYSNAIIEAETKMGIKDE